MTAARQEVHDFVRDLYRNTDLRRAFGESPAATMTGYGLTSAECKLLVDGSFPALHELGMHPLMQMVYAVARSPEITKQITFRDYLSDLE